MAQCSSCSRHVLSPSLAHPPRLATPQPTIPVGSLLAYLSTQPQILFFGVVIWVHEVGIKQSIAENIDGLDDCRWRTHYCRSWRSDFAPQLDPSVAIVTACMYFPDILWFSHLLSYVGALEIAWWCRDWIGITRSWLM